MEKFEMFKQIKTTKKLNKINKDLRQTGLEDAKNLELNSIEDNSVSSKSSEEE